MGELNDLRKRYKEGPWWEIMQREAQSGSLDRTYLRCEVCGLEHVCTRIAGEWMCPSCVLRLAKHPETRFSEVDFDDAA